MVALFVTFEVEGELDGFIAWFGKLAAESRRAPGCEEYQLLLDPLHPGRAATVEVWRTEAERDAHLLMAHHIEMVALGTSRWGMHNFVARRWPDAAPPIVSRRERSDETNPSRPEMARLVGAFVDAGTQRAMEVHDDPRLP